MTTLHDDAAAKTAAEARAEECAADRPRAFEEARAEEAAASETTSRCAVPLKAPEGAAARERADVKAEAPAPEAESLHDPEPVDLPPDEEELEDERRRARRERFLDRFREPRAYTATRLSFFFGGFLLALWATLVPYVRQALDLDEAHMGWLLLCLGLGSLTTMPFTGAIVGRWGCRKTLRWSIPIAAALCMLLASPFSPYATAATLALFGAAFGVIDVAMSVHSVEVEKRAKKALLSGFYAFYPIGGVAGSLVMSLFLHAGLPITSAVILLASLASIVWIGVGDWVLAGAGREAQGSSKIAIPRGIVVVFGAVTFVLYLADGAILDWGGLLLTREQGAAMENAGMGYALFSVAMTIMRLVGNRAVALLGPRLTVLVGSVVGAAAFGCAVLFNNAYVSCAAFFIVGIGAANITPVTFSEAGRQKRMPMNAALAAVSTVGYSGILVGPALIGAIAHATSLHAAFLFVAALLVATALCSAFYPKKEAG